MLFSRTCLVDYISDIGMATDIAYDPQNIEIIMVSQLFLRYTCVNILNLDQYQGIKCVIGFLRFVVYYESKCEFH